MSADEKKNPRCFMDITIGDKPAGRIVVELRADVVPKTAKTSEHCAPAKKDSATRARPFIE